MDKQKKSISDRFKIEAKIFPIEKLLMKNYAQNFNEENIAQNSNKGNFAQDSNKGNFAQTADEGNISQKDLMRPLTMIK